MRKLFFFITLPIALTMPSQAWAGELKLTMDNGLVTLVARDVPLSTLLAEWAKIGKTTVVNGDKLMTPVTLTLENTPERKALDIILRSAAGYMVAERVTPIAGASVFDRVMILPTSQAPAFNPATQRQPQFQQPPRGPQPFPVPVEDDDAPQPMPVPSNQPGGANGPVTSPLPTGPLTAPRPGMLPQPPQQPMPAGVRPPGGGGTGPGGGPGGGGQ